LVPGIIAIILTQLVLASP